MSGLKWIGAVLGWSFGGPIGAIIGVALGSLGDAFAGKEGFFLGQRSEQTRGRQQQRQQPNYRRQTDYRTQQQRRAQTTSGDFEVSLLILASVVIKADGKQDQRELDFVRQQFVSMYGKDRANKAFRLFKGISSQTVPLREVCIQIQQMMDHASRLQLLHFLYGIAKADGMVTTDEERQIYTISGYLGISSRDYNSIKAMFYNSQDNAYKILEITKTASIDEIKKAYRHMAKKYHPDKVEHLGEEHKKGAEMKFKQVLEAYEQLQKERGF